MGPDQVVSVLETAVAAFEIRFEKELDSKWRDLAGKTRDAIMSEGLEIDAHPVEKYRLLSQFCDDASDAVAPVVEKYFPRLLQVAVAQVKHFGGRSPLTWTEEKIFTLICNFFAMDEQFDETSTPRDSSLVLRTAERIITGGRYLDDRPSSEFCLPGWAKMTPHQLIGLLRPDSPVWTKTEPALSRSDTLEWVKWKEWQIRRGVEQQISDASLDGMIQAGGTGPSKQANAKVSYNDAHSSPITGQEVISFIRGRDGTKRVLRGSNVPRALVRTYDELCPLLAQVRTMVIDANGKISAAKLEREFKGTLLYAAASIEDYQEFIVVFADRTVTAKNVAKTFLGKKLSRTPASLESSISQARKQMNAGIKHG